MNDAVQEKLENFARLMEGLGKTDHHHPADFPKAVRTFVEIYRSGEDLHPDDVKHFFEDKGWDKQDARDMGEMADIVMYTLKEVGII